MRTCEACGRDFQFWRGRHYTCPYCGYNTHPRSSHPRSLKSLRQMERDRKERKEREAQRREYLDLESD